VGRRAGIGGKEVMMTKEMTSDALLALLNDALARELQVSVQYMMQHAIEAGHTAAAPARARPDKQSQFIGTHRPYFLPGNSLKKIAITEMRHAEAIAERIVLLGGEPVTQPAAITIGKTPQEMLAEDRQQGRGAVALYGQIIEEAGRAGDEATRALFRRILVDEEAHHRAFSELLGQS